MDLRFSFIDKQRGFGIVGIYCDSQSSGSLLKVDVATCREMEF